MKRFVMIILALISLSWGGAQKWEHTIGETYLNEESRRITEHYDKGYIITGTYTTEGGYNIKGWVIKTDINGNVLWNKSIGADPDQVIIEKTLYDEQGNLYISGLLWGDLNMDYPLTLKLNPCGEIEWCKLFGFLEYEYGSFYDAILLDNGDLLALACMPDEEQHDVIFLFCISPDGEYKWKKSFASKDDYPLFEFRLGRRIQFFDDIYIISGYTYAPHPNYPTISSIRPMFIGIDTLFNEKWVLVFGMEENMKGKALTSIPINDSLFMGMGRYRYIDTIVGGETQDAWAMLYNQQGEQTGYTVISKEKLGNEVNESVFYEVERINDSIFISTAGFYITEDDEYKIGEIVFDTVGNVYNYNLRKKSSTSIFLCKTFDNKFTIASTFFNSNLISDIYFYKINDQLEHDTIYPGNYAYDSLCISLPIQSGVIDVSGCDIITSIEEIPTLEEYNKHKSKIIVNAFPNPSSEGTVTLSFQNTAFFQNMELKCFDVFGKKVHSETIYQFQGESILDIQSWESGVYFVIVYVEEKPSGEYKFVVQ